MYISQVPQEKWYNTAICVLYLNNKEFSPKCKEIIEIISCTIAHQEKYTASDKFLNDGYTLPWIDK